MPAPKPSHNEDTENFVHNRIRDILIHISWYSFKGEARLAHDSRVSKAGLSRIINGQSSPSFRILCRIVAALEKAVGRPIDPREVVSFTGTYPTPSVCDLVGCRGCLPDSAYDENEERKPGFPDSLKGQWSVAPERQQGAPARLSPSQPANQQVSNKEAT